MQDLSSQPGMNPHHLHWKSGVLTAEAQASARMLQRVLILSLGRALSLWLQLLFTCVYIEDPGTVAWRDLPSSRSSLMLLLPCKFLAPGGYWLIVHPAQAALALSIAWVNGSDYTALHPGLCVLPPASSWECLGPWLSASVRRAVCLHLEPVWPAALSSFTLSTIQHVGLSVLKCGRPCFLYPRAC